jgi:radical SAM/Cys-rich protein
MHSMMPLLRETEFPPLRRGALETLQVNLGYRCNQACLHCHVNAGPSRKEQMSLATVRLVLDFLHHSKVGTLDITGGAPELNPNFRLLVSEAHALGKRTIDRCNLTILEEPGHEDLAAFLASEQVEIIASMPCYLRQNVDAQRGKGVYDASISALRRLNALGYGEPGTGLILDLVFNPLGPELPPSQGDLEADYKRELKVEHGIVFNSLYTMANMPIARFGSTLVTRGEFDGYMHLLRSSHNPRNLQTVMCLGLISVNHEGYVYDCDFNQMLGMPLKLGRRARVHLQDLLSLSLSGNPVQVADHCFGCTAGRGSSCGGALS